MNGNQPTDNRPFPKQIDHKVKFIQRKTSRSCPEINNAETKFLVGIMDRRLRIDWVGGVCGEVTNGGYIKIYYAWTSQTFP